MSELTEILAEHAGCTAIDDDGACWWKCDCGAESDESEIFASEQEAEEWGRVHLAAVIEASGWLRIEKEEAWDEGYSHCFDATPDDDVRSLTDNPYREAVE